MEHQTTKHTLKKKQAIFQQKYQKLITNLRCLTPLTTRVVGSSRFKFPFNTFSKLVFFFTLRSESRETGLSLSSVLTTMLDLLPSLEISKRSNPAAGRKIKSVQYFTRNLKTRLANSSLTRYPCFLRFRRTRPRFLPNSSGSSSETEIDTLLLLNIEEEIDGNKLQQMN